jgi:leucyl aminopeptidase (aminopeptidase T)
MRIVDVALATAARRLVEATLALHPGEPLLIVHDEAHRPIAESILDAALTISAKASLCAIEGLGPRPHVRLDPELRKRMAEAKATILLVDLVREEGRMRADFVEATSAAGIRHAHMVGVSRLALLAGLSTEPARIAALARAIKRKLGPSSKIHVRSARGTDLVVRCHPSQSWTEASGALKPGEYANVPAGELIAHPADVEGRYVADGTLGDVDGSLGGTLHDEPVVFEILKGRITSIESKSTVRAVKLRQRFAELRDLDRVGLVVFGTNLGLSEPTGVVAVDQKAPGLHLSFGHTMRARTGASWDLSAWIAVTATALDVDIDGSAVLRGGRYLFTA